MRYRHLRRTVIAVLATIAFLLVLGTLALRILDSRWVRDTAVRWLESSATRQGIELRIESLEWGWMPLRIRLGGVAVERSGIRAEIDRLEVDLNRIRVARRVLELGTVVAHGVHVRLKGLPERRRDRSDLSQLRVAVRHLDVRDLSFEGSQLPGKLAVTLDGVNAAWATEDQTPKGYFTVDRALLRAKGIEEFEAQFRARIEARNGIDLVGWSIRNSGIRLDGHGRIARSEGVRVDATGTVDLTELGRTVKARTKLRGTCLVSATLDTTRRELVQLEFRSRHLEAAGFPFDRVRGRLVVERDRLYGSLDQADFHGGRLVGSYRLAHLKGPTRPHSVELYGDGIRLDGLLSDLRVPRAGLSATFSTDAVLEWNGRQIRQAVGRAEADLKPQPGQLPVRGRVDCDITPGGLLRFAADDLSIKDSTVDWQGPLTIGSWEPAWSIHASPAVLEQVVPLVNAWTRSQVLPTSITGLADLDVTLSGPWRQLVVGARIEARPVRMPPIKLDRLVAEASIRGSELHLGTTRFSVGDGHGEAEGTIAWGTAVGDEQLDVGLRGHRLPLHRVASWLGAEGYADGALSFTGGLRGAVAAPRGSWAVGVDDAMLFGQPLGDGLATVDLAQGRFDGRGIRFEHGLEGSVWWDVLTGDVGGDLDWQKMPVAALGPAVARVTGGTADAHLQFTMPGQGEFSGRIEALFPDASLVVEADGGNVRLEGSLADAVTGHAALERTAEGGLQGGGELTLGSSERLLAQLLPESVLPLEGGAKAEMSVTWPRDGPPSMTGQLEDLQLSLDGEPVRLLSPARFTVSERGLELAGLHVGVLADDLFARLTVAPDGTLSGNASGTLDALLLRFLLPDWEPAGRATGVVELLGTVDRPLFEGIAELDQVSFRIPQTRTILSGINGTLLLSSDEVILEGVDFRLMQGTGRGAGRLALRDGTVAFALDGTMSSLRYEVFPGLIADVSGWWGLNGPIGDLDLSGHLTVDRASLRRKDDVAAILVDWFGGSSPPASGQGLHLDLHVEADETIEVRNPFVRLVGSASLDISGSSTQPGLVGKIEFEEGGEVTLQTIRYELERGSLTFADPSTVDPLIELSASTWVQNYQISIRLTGTRDRLIPSVASNPPLSESEIYSLLAFGYRDERLGGGAMGVGFATSVLSSAIAAEIDRRARNLLPVDQIRVDPFAESTTGNPTARISVVKQLNPTWTFIVQSNLSAEREEVVVSRWYLAPGLFVEASRDIDGSYGVDLKLRRPY